MSSHKRRSGVVVGASLAISIYNGLILFRVISKTSKVVFADHLLGDQQPFIDQQ